MTDQLDRLKTALYCACLVAASLALGCTTPQSEQAVGGQAQFTPKERLGKLLFLDTNLSTPPGQSCATCHSPRAGFGDPVQQLPVSRGAHPDRFGNRNDLTAAYAAFIPPLRFDEDEDLWVGGLFWDGRAADLAEQARGPPLNPLEMANPDVETITEALRAAEYRDLFFEVFGDEALDDAARAFDLMADAIAAYEATSELSPFDSKYDLFLAGEVQLSEQELRGMALYELEAKGNCAACHPNRPGADSSPPLFTDHTYDNLGVPQNPENPFYSLPPEVQSGRKPLRRSRSGRDRGRSRHVRHVPGPHTAKRRAHSAVHAQRRVQDPVSGRGVLQHPRCGSVASAGVARERESR